MLSEPFVEKLENRDICLKIRKIPQKLKCRLHELEIRLRVQIKAILSHILCHLGRVLQQRMVHKRQEYEGLPL